MKFPPDQATGYYLPIKFTGTKGEAIKRLSNNKILVFGETGDTDTTMNVVFSVNPGDGKISLKSYDNKLKAVLDNDGESTEVDCTTSTFK